MRCPATPHAHCRSQRRRGARRLARPRRDAAPRATQRARVERTSRHHLHPLGAASLPRFPHVPPCSACCGGAVAVTKTSGAARFVAREPSRWPLVSINRPWCTRQHVRTPRASASGRSEAARCEASSCCRLTARQRTAARRTAPAASEMGITKPRALSAWRDPPPSRRGGCPPPGGTRARRSAAPAEGHPFHRRWAAARWRGGVRRPAARGRGGAGRARTTPRRTPRAPSPPLRPWQPTRACVAQPARHHLRGARGGVSALARRASPSPPAATPPQRGGSAAGAPPPPTRTRPAQPSGWLCVHMAVRRVRAHLVRRVRRAPPASAACARCGAVSQPRARAQQQRTCGVAAAPTQHPAGAPAGGVCPRALLAHSAAAVRAIAGICGRLEALLPERTLSQASFAPRGFAHGRL